MTRTTLTTRTGHPTLKTLATFAVAPFIALAYVVLLPVAGLATLAWFALKALWQGGRALKLLRDVALFVAAPFVGLVYIALLPVVGLVTLAAIEFKAVTRARPAPAAAAA